MILMILLAASDSVLSVDKILFAHKSYSESSELCIFILDKEIDHLIWINGITELFASGSESPDIMACYKECGLGRFLYGEESRVLSE